MNITTAIRHTLHTGIVVLALGASSTGMASTLVYEDTVLAESQHGRSGTGFFLDSITLQHSGSYELTLTDFVFPEAFRKIAVAITDHHQLLAGLWGPGSISFNADAGDYFLGLAYQTGKEWKLGMYGVELRYLDALPTEVSPVPLPGAAVLMLSGLAGLAGLRAPLRRRSDHYVG